MRITTRQFSIQYHWGTRSLTTDIDKFIGFLSFLCSEDFFIQMFAGILSDKTMAENFFWY